MAMWTIELVQYVERRATVVVDELTETAARAAALTRAAPLADWVDGEDCSCVVIERLGLADIGIVAKS